MAKKSNNTLKTILKSKKFFVLIVVLIILSLSLIVATLQKNTNLSTNGEKDKPYYTQGKGGSYRMVEDAYEGAVNAWKHGDKQKAKELAQEGLEENRRLTVEQQKKIPNQMSKIFDLYDITQGSYGN